MKEKIMGVLDRVPHWIQAVVACVVVICMAVVVDKVVQDYIHENRCEIVEDDFSCVFQIDSMEQKGGELVLNGWVFKLGVDSKEKDFDVILYDYANDESYYMDVEDVVREDVNNYFLCEFDYANSGFVASIEENEIDLETTNYELLIRVRDEQMAYKSGVYISESKLMYTEPESFVPLDVAGTELEEIVYDGVLRVYRPDVGIYVYQYEGNLYWIADEDYIFEEDGSTYTYYMIDTTQSGMLPKEALDNGWVWDNKGFIYENKEMKNVSSNKYRVAVEKVPIEFSVEKIWTGYSMEDWIWRQYFRAWYEFN